MPSKLEDTLIRGGTIKRKIRRSLIEALDPASLRSLRRCCRSLARLIDQDPTRLFRDIYITAPLSPLQTLAMLKRVSMFCHRLTIKVGHPKPRKETKFAISRQRQDCPSQKGVSQTQPSWLRRRENRTTLLQGSITDTSACAVNSEISSTTSTFHLDNHLQSSLYQEWLAIFFSFSQLSEVTFDVNGDRKWPGRSAVEEMLIVLRSALETAQPFNLQVVRLAPIHAMGMIHMRWGGFSAFGSTSATSHELWRKLSKLDLQIHNPLLPHLELSPSQRNMFKKLLHSYLQSFSPTLCCLRFVWLGGLGPNPLTLDLDSDMVGGQQNAISWPRLQRLSLGGVFSPQTAMQFAKDRSQVLTSLKILKPALRACPLDHAIVSDEAVWVDAVLDPQPVSSAGPIENEADARSSIYSQEGMDTDVGSRHMQLGRSLRNVPSLMKVKARFKRGSAEATDGDVRRASSKELLSNKVFQG